MEAGVDCGVVLADAGHGPSAAFRQGLSAGGLAWAVGIPRHQKVYPADVRLTFPVAGRGRPRQRHVPGQPAVAAEAMLAGAAWQAVSWRRGTKGKLAARFAAERVRVADGPPQRIGHNGAQHAPGDEVWLVGEHRSSGERKDCLANLPAGTDLRTLAAAAKARWVRERAHQQLKEELGLDPSEGRAWTGRHRHARMTLIALAPLQHQRLASPRRGGAGRGERSRRTAASTEPAGRAPSQRRPNSCAGARDRRSAHTATDASVRPRATLTCQGSARKAADGRSIRGIRATTCSVSGSMRAMKPRSPL